jgi:DNA-binding transcriptional MerR regulator
MTLLAFDYQSARHIDADGRLHVSKSNISKAQVSKYYGQEIPGYLELGLDPTKIYKLYRPEEELAKAASTFNNLPILRTHQAVTANDPKPDLVIGSIGSDVSFEKPYLTASLCIWDAQEIAAIQSGVKQELSCSYRYVPKMSPGEYNGEKYDGEMTEIQANHLALVEAGRAGSDVYVSDENTIKENEMENEESKNSLKAKLDTLSGDFTPEQLAKILAVLTGEKAPDVVEAIEPNGEDDEVVEVQGPLTAQGAPEVKKAPELNSEVFSRLALFLEAKGFSPEDIRAACAMLDLDDLPGYDEEEVKKEDEKIAAAMDSMRKEFKQLEAAKHAVRGTVGDVLGMDSAEQVYRFALDALSIKHKDVKELAALSAMYSIAAGKKSPAVAQDSQSSVVKFPGLARFK